MAELNQRNDKYYISSTVTDSNLVRLFCHFWYCCLTLHFKDQSQMESQSQIRFSLKVDCSHREIMVAYIVNTAERPGNFPRFSDGITAGASHLIPLYVLQLPFV
jgi:hypothetical protein